MTKDWGLSVTGWKAILPLWTRFKKCQSHLLLKSFDSHEKDVLPRVTIRDLVPGNINEQLNQSTSKLSLTSLPNTWANKFPYRPMWGMQLWTNGTINHHYCFYKRSKGGREIKGRMKERKRDSQGQTWKKAIRLETWDHPREALQPGRPQARHIQESNMAHARDRDDLHLEASVTSEV